MILGLCLLVAACTDMPSSQRSGISRAKRRQMTRDSLSHFTALPERVTSPRNNPANPAKEKLGQLLFFDPILSGNRDVACATCHHPSHGFAENLDISIGVNGKGFGSRRAFLEPNSIPFTKRNAQTILNTAFNGIDTRGHYKPEDAPMFWDVRTKSLEDQALEPLKALEEMRGYGYDETTILPELEKRIAAIPAYHDLFREAFGTDYEISTSYIGKAIAAYERTLLTNHSRFDQYMRGDSSAISLSEKDGFRQFIQSGCGNCHNGPMFSDYQLHVIGAPDIDKLPTPDQGADSLFAFRTPTLRNLRFTAPYMHNGSLKSLQRVLEFYEDIANGKMRNEHLSREELDPLIREIDLRVRDMSSIISFLNTLNDHTFDHEVPEAVPSGLPVGGNIQ